jgi:putative transposase
MTDDPATYPWSSYGWHAGVGSQFRWLDIDPCFEGLGNSADERAMRYREFVQSAIPTGEWELIREALQRGQLTGTKRFSDEIEAIIGQRIENRKQGRPRKETPK